MFEDPSSITVSAVSIGGGPRKSYTGMFQVVYSVPGDRMLSEVAPHLLTSMGLGFVIITGPQLYKTGDDTIFTNAARMNKPFGSPLNFELLDPVPFYGDLEDFRAVFGTPEISLTKGSVDPMEAIEQMLASLQEDDVPAGLVEDPA